MLGTIINSMDDFRLVTGSCLSFASQTWRTQVKLTPNGQHEIAFQKEESGFLRLKLFECIETMVFMLRFFYYLSYDAFRDSF